MPFYERSGGGSEYASDNEISLVNTPRNAYREVYNGGSGRH